MELNRKSVELPSLEQIQQEKERLRYRNRYVRTLGSTVGVLLVVAAVAFLVATIWTPVLQIYGQSMTPTLEEGDITLAVKTSDFDRGDVVAFYYNNNILVKRVIGEAGDWIDIDKYGNVYVNNNKIDEPYLVEKAYGDTNIQLPYQVPDGKIFVMGDHRATSTDSRNTSIGCVSQEQIVGRILFCVWPLNRLGAVS